MVKKVSFSENNKVKKYNLDKDEQRGKRKAQSTSDKNSPPIENRRKGNFGSVEEIENKEPVMPNTEAALPDDIIKAAEAFLESPKAHEIKKLKEEFFGSDYNPAVEDNITIARLPDGSYKVNDHSRANMRFHFVPTIILTKDEIIDLAKRQGVEFTPPQTLTTGASKTPKTAIADVPLSALLPKRVPPQATPIEKAIVEIHNMMVSWATGPNDKRKKWLKPLVQELEKIKETSLSTEEKTQKMIEAISATYLSAKQGQGSYNAIRIIEDTLEAINIPLPKMQPTAPQQVTPLPTKPDISANPNPIPLSALLPKRVPLQATPIEKAIIEIHNMMVSWATSPNDKRNEWLKPLVQELEKIKATSLSTEEKTQKMIEAISATYLSAKQGQGSYNAIRIIEDALEAINIPLPKMQPTAPQQVTPLPTKPVVDPNLHVPPKPQEATPQPTEQNKENVSVEKLLTKIKPINQAKTIQFMNEKHQQEFKQEQPQIVHQKPINSQRLDSILMKNFDSLNKDYKQYHQVKHKNDRRILGLYQATKAVGKNLSGITNERKQQLKEISNAFDFLKKESTLLPQEKAVLAFAQLDKIQQSLTNKSSLKTFCETLKNQIELAAPGTRAKFNDPNNKQIYLNTLQAIKNPLPEQKNSSNRKK